jgi:hypothetical protein
LFKETLKKIFVSRLQLCIAEEGLYDIIAGVGSAKSPFEAMHLRFRRLFDCNQIWPAVLQKLASAQTGNARYIEVPCRADLATAAMRHSSSFA